MAGTPPSILEIGPAGYIKAAYPETTTFFATENFADVGQGDPSSLLDLARLLAGQAFDLIVASPPTRSPWHWRTLSRMIGNRRLSQKWRRPGRLWAPQLLRLARKTPLAVIDFADPSYIDRDNIFLLDRATRYFKRELPFDEWRLLTKTASSTLPSKRMRGKERWRARLAKVRPLPLGLPTGSLMHMPGAAAAFEKTADVFFAGTVKGFPVRERALAELEGLRGQGIRVDSPTEKLSQPDFYRRCAQAWLTLSPEGLGWDCFRHYEAAACGSVPLISQPSIRRHAPLLDGEHAIIFDAEEGALSRTIRRALADKAALAAIARRGRDHVLLNHTPEAIARYVVEETLGSQTAEP